MSLVTLSGTISAANLNNNFRDKISALQSSMQDSGKVFQYDLSVLDLISTTPVGNRQLDFTLQQQMNLCVVGLTVWAPDATSRTTLCRLQAIDINGTEVPKYLLDETVLLTLVTSAGGEAHATRYNPGITPWVPLYRGVTYRLSLEGPATALDRAHAYVVARTFRRKK